VINSDSGPLWYYSGSMVT